MQRDEALDPLEELNNLARDDKYGGGMISRKALIEVDTAAVKLRAEVERLRRELRECLEARRGMFAEIRELRRKLAEFENVEDTPAELQVNCATFKGEQLGPAIRIEKALYDELREDRARLDCLENSAVNEGLSNWPRFMPTSQNPECAWAWYTDDLDKGPFETLREALDAARKAGAK